MRRAAAGLSLVVGCLPSVAPPPATAPMPPSAPIAIKAGEPLREPLVSEAEAEAPSALAHGVAESVEALRPKFRDCYNRALVAQPALSGAVMFDVTVNDKGLASSVQARQITLPLDLVTCIERVLRRGPYAVPESPPQRIAIPIRFVRP